MNLNDQPTHRGGTAEHQTAMHAGPQNRRSAKPQEVDTRGQKQRARHYINEKDAELERIKAQYPNHVKHKDYVQSRANRSGVRTLSMLVLIVFLFFSLSLLAVYGIAVAVKNARTPEGTPAGEQTSVTDTTAAEPPADTTAPDTPTDVPPEPPAIYASVTDTTANLSSEIGSTNAILIDLESFTVLAQKGPGERIYPASMTKIMTLLVGVENMTSLDQKATVTQQTIDYCCNEDATRAGFEPNETVTVEDLLYGIILPSGADATMTLAECIAGSEEEFVRMMNTKAAELGLKNTHFVNTSGLHHPDHYSTVHDIALILKAAMANDTCFKVLSANHYITSETTQHPTGKPLYSIVHSRISSIKSNDFTVIGGKTGYTNEARQCLATYAVASDGSHDYIFVSANAADRNIPVKDAEYAYSTYIE